MALTLPELAAALRIQASPTEPVAEPHLNILERQLSVAEGLIEAYAPNAPADTKDEAAIRLVGYLYEQAPTGVQSQNPIRHSGALPLLSPYASVAGASTRDAETA